MGYFRELPNLEYQSFLSDSISSQSYLKVKNLFRRNKLRDDLQSNFTVFDKYEIMEGARPDTVAEELFGDSELDWVVLITAGIINVRDEWPLSDRELYDYSYNIHGENLTDIHHYETTEVKDSKEVHGIKMNRLILPKGKVVDKDFKIPKPDEVGTGTATELNPIYIGINETKPGRVQFQFKGENSLYGCKLPVEGRVFSDRNTRSTSLVDLMKAYQVGYNMVNNQIADILVDELGTVIMFDQNALPRHSMGEDWGKNNMAKAYVAMKDFGMLPLDTSITNTENATNFNH